MPYRKLYENGYLENPFGISVEHDAKTTPNVFIHTTTTMMMTTTVIMYTCFSFPSAAIFRAGE